MFLSTYIDVLRPLLCALAVIFFAGCFRVGLPEYVSSGELTSTGVSASPRLLKLYEADRPYALVVQSPEPVEQRGGSLGHQYLLGIFPFTRLFLEHGRQALVEERTAQLLAERGFRVLAAPAGQPLALEVPLSRVIQPRLDGLRINAYDILVIRLADVSATLTLDYLSPHTLEPTLCVSETLDESEFRKQAHAPVLAALTERSLTAALENALRKSPSARQMRVLSPAGARTSAAEAPLWLLAPTFVRPPPPVLGQFIASSYGFDSVEAFRPTAVLRVAQRGLEAHARESGIVHVSALAPVEVSVPLHALRSSIIAIGYDDSGDLSLEIEFAELFSGIVQRSARCRLLEAEASGVDGAAVITLERATGRAMAAFFGGDESTLCK